MMETIGKRKTMKVCIIIGLILCTCASGILSIQVQAVPVTVYISGHIIEASGVSLPSTIYEGVSFTGSYTYNSSTLDSDTNPLRGEYTHDAPYGISISLGGYEFKTAESHTDQFEIRIGNDMPGDGVNDYYIVFSDDNVSIPSDGLSVRYISWYLGDSTHSALSSDALPVTAPNVEEWNNGNELTIRMFDSSGQGVAIYGTVTQAVPEPITGIFLLIGSFILRSKRKTKALN